MVEDSVDFEEIERDLARSSAYPHAPSRVEVGRTHISLLFFAGERVYKVKRPVDLGFVDFTDRERRRFFCAEEVRLNQPLSRGVHLGVVPIVRSEDGRLCVAGADDARPAVEWAVEMRRLPAAGMLDALFDRGEVDNARIRELVGILVDFHRSAATGAGVDEFGTPEAVAALVEENFAQTRPFVAESRSSITEREDAVGALTPERHAFLAERARAFLRDRRELFLQRVRSGRIRDGHGDLHAGNVCVTAVGIAIYDRIEFAARLRCGDVACDLAFLAMDLDQRGFPAFSSYLVQDYAARAEDDELGELMPFYKAYRAVVRAKVACLSAADATRATDEREAKRAEAVAYFDLAACYEIRPALVLLCGLPASGKSFLAKRVARPLRAALHRSDVRRKQLAGIAPTERAGDDYEAGIYSPGTTDRTYRELLEQTVRELRAGRSVVVDASFARRARRRDFVDAAARLGLRWCLVRVDADEGVVRERLAARAREANEVSDADLAVYLRARDAFEAPSELPPANVLHLQSGVERAEDSVARVVDRLVATERATG